MTSSLAISGGGEEVLPNLLQEVCEIVAKVLHLDRSEFEEKTPLRELGFDSVNAVEVASAMARRFGIKLIGAELAEVSDCAQLAGAVAACRPAGGDMRDKSVSVDNVVDALSSGLLSVDMALDRLMSA